MQKDHHIVPGADSSQRNPSRPARPMGIAPASLAERLVEASAYLHHQADARDIARYVSILAHQLIPAADGVTISVRVHGVGGYAVLGVYGYPHFPGTMIIDADSEMAQRVQQEFWLRTPDEIMQLFTVDDDDNGRRFLATESMGIRHNSVLGMPMRIRRQNDEDDVVGAVWLGNWTLHNPFTANDHTRLRLLTQIAALAFDDAEYATIYQSDGQSVRRWMRELPYDAETRHADRGDKNGVKRVDDDSSESNDLDFAVEVPEFSERELSVLRLIGAGMTAREIAERLYISVNTVRTHRTNLLNKLGVHSSTAAVARARELGVLS
ncbi:helix-turn-helix transcriptional regulator [Bifidobacterium callimiconis]|uniref:Helix-turn-helix transcriptional regulator n=1 Tax=Bifidobacterium callimiconis TaxID=2306973 RepID=A0A430FDD7_9BIFI|nr:response regulator transcription factor [Bifidobacterium callimiconis]MBT1176887.1 response regulator transcription factor [Bifidobacterium callimiconis]RSX50875.1 helix-turn-helix transcriptional regulator [Bifidobacterium callimiconis]